MNDWILVDKLDKNTTNQAFQMENTITVPYVEGVQPGEIVYIYKKGTGEIKYKCVVEEINNSYAGKPLMTISLMEEYPDGLLNDFALERKGFFAPAISMHAPSNMEEIINHIFEKPVKKKSSRVKWGIAVGVLVISLVCGSVLSMGVYDSLTRYKMNKHYSERVIETIDDEDVVVDGDNSEYEKQWIAVFRQFEESGEMNGISFFTEDASESSNLTAIYDKICENAAYERNNSYGTDVYYSDPETNAFVVITDFEGKKTFDDRNIKWFASSKGDGVDESFYPADFPVRAGEDMNESLSKLGITQEMIKYLEKNDGYMSGTYNGERFYISTYSYEKNEKNIYISIGNKTISLDYRDNVLDVVGLWTTVE